ncbi:MAG TPA: hypothetical protein PLQ29_00915 [Spirochaetales bacterium]|nr:hypothetical protein [Spirochaetales bacterium]HPG85230.1 hypothetical protein [Spirochaetales bacterium]
MQDRQKLVGAMFRAPGFAAVAAATVTLMYRAGLMAWPTVPLLAAIKLPLLAGLVVGLALEAKAAFVISPGEAPSVGSRGVAAGAAVGDIADAEFADAAAVLASALIGYLAIARLGLNAVLASSLLGLAGALLLPKRAVAIYCGSFAGMAAPAAFETMPSVALSGVIAGVFYVSCKPCFPGVGGRLGAAAYAGSLGSSLLLGARLTGDELPGLGLGLGILAYAILGSALTWTVSVRLGRGAVMASAFWGAVAGAVIPALHGPVAGSLLDAAFFCGSFAGMSSAARLRNEAEAGVAGAFCGLSFILALPWLGGAGGKLGTLAFGSTLAYLGLRETVRRALSRLRKT